jgi:hypothetical protein
MVLGRGPLCPRLCPRPWLAGRSGSGCTLPGMTMFLAMLIKPLLALLVFGFALGLANIVMRWLPEGRIKRLLTRPIGRGPSTPRRWQ